MNSSACTITPTRSTVFRSSQVSSSSSTGGATAFFNCDVEKAWNILSWPSRLRNHDYVPITWDDELRDAPFSIYKFLRIIARLHTMAPKTGVFHWLSDKPGGVYHYLAHRIDEANGPTPDDLRAMTDDELQNQIAKTRQLADEWVLTLWAGFNFLGRGLPRPARYRAREVVRR